jgi:GT2 family glycosyltransferase
MIKNTRDVAAIASDAKIEASAPSATATAPDKKVKPPLKKPAELHVSPFAILSSEATGRGSVIVAFSGSKGDAPLFWFENKAGDQFPVEPASLEFSDLNGVNLLDASDVAPSWVLPDTRVGAYGGKNFSKTWSLSDIDTFFIAAAPSLKGETPNLSAVFCDPITAGVTPVRAEKDYRFSMLAVVHRCSAWVEIECLSAEGNVLSTETRKVVPGLMGGEFEADYDHLELPFKTPAGAAAVKISVHKGPTTQSEDGFVFFAKPCLVELPVEGPVRVVSKATLGPLKRNPALHMFSAEIPVPAALCLGQKDPVTLAVGIGAETRRVSDLAVSWNSPVVIEACWLENGDILFRGARPMDSYGDLALGIFVDGELSAETVIVDIGGFEHRLSLARQHLDGRPHVVEIRLMPQQFVLANTFGVTPFSLTPWESLQEYARAPFSLTASPAAVHHYRSYRAWTKNAKTRALPDLAFLVDELLQGFRKRTNYPKIAFPKVETPQVSIVIPVHNKFEVTYFCLCSLLFAYNDASFEVIVTDDGSTDTTLKIEEIVSGISVVRHEAAMGFVESCNDGAAIARGDYIFFLNNDTEVTAGALDELLKVFNRFDNVGLAGSKLLYPNGRLQEAGGVVWKTGNPWNVGRNGNPNDPQYCYLRQTDYISGAAVMIPRQVWTEVGGFSHEFAPAYFEDADLAMKVRDSGRFVVYVPNSVIFHFEGQSAGTDTNSGMKRFQEVNRPKFKRKWAKLYSRNGAEGVRLDREKDRNVEIRILMLDHGFPFVDADAGSYAAFQEIRLLQSLGAKITFLPRNLAWMDRHTAALEHIGVECLYAPFVINIEDYIRDYGVEYDLIYITRFRIADEFTGLIRRHAPDAKIILNLADLHFLRELREAAAGTDGYSFDGAIDTRDAELRTIASVDLTLSYTDVEATVIQSHLLDAAKVAKVPWVVDANEAPRPKFAETRDILFLGGFAHHPNKEAVKFFARSVMPLLREKLPDARFRVVGSRAPAEILALESDSVEIVGFVKDLDALFATARVYVAPLLAGAGIKGKVIEGMAQGIPSVLSPLAAEGTGLASGFDCFIARTPEEWVDSIVKLYTDETLWTAMGDAAKDGARQRFSFAAGRETMREALANVEIFAHTTGLYYNRARP